MDALPPEPVNVSETHCPQLQARISFPFEINSVGHIMANGVLAGQPILILIDSGASTTVVHQATAQRLGLHGDKLAELGGGVGGAAVEASNLGVMELIIEGQKLGDVGLVSMDLSHVGAALSRVGLRQPDLALGSNVLTARNAIIDYGAKCIFLDAG